MNEVAMLRGSEPREILQTAIEKKVPATMSYRCGGKQHAIKVLLTGLGADWLDIQPSPRKKDAKPTNIKVNQTVDISLKYGYGKFSFETTVIGFEPLSGPKDNQEHPSEENPTILLGVPDRIEIVQRRNYFRVKVPDSLKVNVTIWHRHNKKYAKSKKQRTETQTSNAPMAAERYWRGRLVDLSTSGVQVVIDTGQKPDFKKRQFVSLRFTPTPYEKPLVLDARIRNVLKTADEKNMCLGLQIVDLEASPQGRQVLQQLCSVVEHYHHINQYSTKQQDFPTTNLPH